MHLFFWKHGTGKQSVVIEKECHDKLPKRSKESFHPVSAPTATATHKVIVHGRSDENGTATDHTDFGLSMIAAMTSDNAAIGYLSGGDLLGGNCRSGDRR